VNDPDDRANGADLAADSDGNVYMVGTYEGSGIDFGHGPLEDVDERAVFVAKFASDGTHLWAKALGQVAGTPAGEAVGLDSAGSIYLGAYFSCQSIDLGELSFENAGGSDVLIAKLNPQGECLWARTFGGGDTELLNSLAVEKGGGVVVAGRFDSAAVDFGGGEILSNLESTSGFVAKLDAGGEYLWANSYDIGETPLDLFFYSSAVDPDGSVYLTGSLGMHPVDFGGGVLNNEGLHDIFLVKLDSDGNYLWSKSYGGPQWDWGQSVDVDAEGNLYLAGEFSSPVLDFGDVSVENTHQGQDKKNGFIAKLDETGHPLWLRNLGAGLSPAVSSRDGLYVTGRFASSALDLGGGALGNAGGADAFLLNLDPNGSHVWSSSFGGEANDMANSIAPGAEGDLFVTGSFESDTMSFGDAVLTQEYDYAPSQHAFLVKLGQ